MSPTWPDPPQVPQVPSPPDPQPRPAGPRIVDPTGLRYDRADTEPAVVPVPAGVELVHFGRDVPEVTPESLGIADDRVAQVLALVAEMTPAEVALVRSYLRPARPTTAAHKARNLRGAA